MSKFESYAKRAEMIYQEARRNYTKVQEDYQAAKAAYDANKRPAGTWKADADKIAKAARAEADYLEAQQRHKSGLAALQTEVKNQLAALREELSEAVQKHYTADPAALDPATLELLKSGILTPREYKHLAGQNADNRTMMRMIAHYAQSAADALPDTADNRTARAALLSVAETGREDGSGILGAFDFAAVTAQKTIQDSRFVADGTAAHWDETGGKALAMMMQV